MKGKENLVETCEFHLLSCKPFYLAIFPFSHSWHPFFLKELARFRLDQIDTLRKFLEHCSLLNQHHETRTWNLNREGFGRRLPAPCSRHKWKNFHATSFAVVYTQKFSSGRFSLDVSVLSYQVGLEELTTCIWPLPVWHGETLKWYPLISYVIK